MALFSIQNEFRYDITRKIFEGGMGIVYRVHDIELGFDVALKTLPVLDPDRMYRLKREFRTVESAR